MATIYKMLGVLNELQFLFEGEAILSISLNMCLVDIYGKQQTRKSFYLQAYAPGETYFCEICISNIGASLYNPTWNCSF